MKSFSYLGPPVTIRRRVFHANIFLFSGWGCVISFQSFGCARVVMLYTKLSLSVCALKPTELYDNFMFRTVLVSVLPCVWYTRGYCGRGSSARGR